jgi:ATP-dependent DNA helicase RecG
LIFHIPKHQFRLPVYAHKKTWQRIDDNLVEMTKARLDAILTQVQANEDWSKVIIQDATVEDLNQAALQKHVINLKKEYSTMLIIGMMLIFLNKSKLTIKGR